MLDNEEFMLETSPRELTQNPLRKIWMPCRNGHIAQRRGKMQPAGKCRKGCDLEVMRGHLLIAFVLGVYSIIFDLRRVSFSPI